VPFFGASEAMMNKRPAEQDDELLITDEAARVLGKTASWLGVMRARGIGPRYLKLDGWRVRYRRADLLQYLLKQRRERASERRAIA
jgi:predicted DNA-binding transcriptional regulator AlpA